MTGRRVLMALAMVLVALGGALAGAGAARADGAALTALAQFRPAASHVTDEGEGIDALLTISQPVPWRVRLLDDPPRLVVDFREVDWGHFDAARLSRATHVKLVRAGPLVPGWSRLVMELDGPYAIATAGMRTGAADGAVGGGAVVHLVLRPEAEAAFAAQAARPDPPGWALPPPAPVPATPRPRKRGTGPLVVVLDPGHGGIDPGAVDAKLHEADIVLAFARKLKEALLRAGGFDVVMTRDEDIFVPLETRLSIARAAGGDLFLSIHADSIPEGRAAGATVYTLADEATDRASEQLAERHDRDDLLAGVDLSGQDDKVAGVLMDLARTETQPRSEALARALVAAIRAAGLRMHSHPHQEAAFSVLKSADIPSALLELGFLSSKGDRKRLESPKWRARMVEAIVKAIGAWSVADAAQAALLRQ